MNLLKELANLDILIKRDFVSTGSLVLDMILSGRCDGQGGWEIGKTCEIFGPAQSGKSYLILKTIANFQQKFSGREYFIFVDDVDNGIDPMFAHKIGVNVEDKKMVITSLRPKATRLITSKAFAYLAEKSKTIKKERIDFAENGFVSSETIEAAFQRIWGFTYLINIPSLYIIDPLSKLSCGYEVQHGLQREEQGKRSKAVHAAMRIIPGRIASSKSLLIISNHPYTGPNDQYTPRLFKKTSAGTALVTTASVRMELDNVKDIKDGKRIIGVNLHITTIKNRGAHPFQEATVSLYWNQVVPKYSGLLSKLVELDFIKQNGGWYSFDNSMLQDLSDTEFIGNKFRAADFENICKDNPEILKAISDIWEKK